MKTLTEKTLALKTKFDAMKQAKAEVDSQLKEQTDDYVALSDELTELEETNLKLKGDLSKEEEKVVNL